LPKKSLQSSYKKSKISNSSPLFLNLAHKKARIHLIYRLIRANLIL
jgi:hypothetical protein